MGVSVAPIKDSSQQEAAGEIGPWAIQSSDPWSGRRPFPCFCLASYIQEGRPVCFCYVVLLSAPCFLPTLGAELGQGDLLNESQRAGDLRVQDSVDKFPTLCRHRTGSNCRRETQPGAVLGPSLSSLV